MKKLFTWCNENILFLLTLLLVVFIPVYPKLPLINIQHTWVYIRAEDFIVLIVLFVLLVQIARRRITINTPMTLPFLVFWMIGAIATLHGILLIFPTTANVFPNVALFSFLRRIEYMSVFYIAYWGFHGRKQVLPFVYVLTGTVFAISLYAMGQRFFGFPAFLTMNEEYAKGIPIVLSSNARIPSTFGGHYDLAAYLVLVLPILISLLFALPSRLAKAATGVVILLASYVMFLTVSRISLIALAAAVLLVIFIQNRRLLLWSIPVLIIGGLLVARAAPKIIERYTSSIQVVDVLVDAQKGTVVGNASIVPKEYFQGKIIRHAVSSGSSSDISLQSASPSGMIIPYQSIPEEVVLLSTSLLSTGENLPHGTGFINLPLSPVIKGTNQFFIEVRKKGESASHEYQIISGPYLVKRTLAYDLSFTTRFQGEWPNTIEAFKKNIFLGSGYGSVSLAVDNNFLRMLGEVGLFGTFSFMSLFVVVGIYIVHAWKSITSPVVRGVVIGVASGIVGLCINALFIDVFEASKVAFSLWVLVGVTVGLLTTYDTDHIDVPRQFSRILLSSPAIIVYLLVAGFALLGSQIQNYFVGDDFTWLRWASECHNGADFFGRCSLTVQTVVKYFTDASGFFYRPGTKLYFQLMYTQFWLNQTAYHVVSLILHLVITVFVYAIAKKLFKDVIRSAIAAGLFMIIGGYSEAVFWVSATGYLFTACILFAAVYAMIRYEESGNRIYIAGVFVLSLIAPLFHEVGVVTPLLSVIYPVCIGKQRLVPMLKKMWYLFVLPVGIYLLARYSASSHWFNGDYSYNLMKFPLNAVGNLFGYGITLALGPALGSLYDSIRTIMRSHIGISFTLLSLIAAVVTFKWRTIREWVSPQERSIIAYSAISFVVVLLPFIGLGNITSRYGYIAAFSICILLVLLFSRLYTYLLSSGMLVARITLALMLSIFSMYHLIQLQRLSDNWHEAGETVRQFLVSVDSHYVDSWKSEPVEFHFSQVPLRRGQAWVFPVGLTDALWFAFQNNHIRVFEHQTSADALSQVEVGSQMQKVFGFTSDGSVKELIKSRGDR